MAGRWNLDDPVAAIRRVEEVETRRAIGALAVEIYRGAVEESESRRDAFWATVAFITAAIVAPKEEEE